MGYLGDDGTTIATAALSDATAAFIATQQAACPTGYVFNPAVNGCQLVAGVATGSASPGMLLLLAIGAYLLFEKGGR